MAYNPITGATSVDVSKIPGGTVWFNPTDAEKQARSDLARGVIEQPAKFAEAAGNMFGAYGNAFNGYGQGLAGLSQAQAGNYGAYAGGLGNLAQNYTNQATARYGANAMAEAARQGAVGNMGSAALGAYGNLGGQALQAWSANQMAYNKALADMYGANQNAVSQYGQSRNSALSGLGDSYAKAAAGVAPATLAGDIAFNFSDAGGGGFGGMGVNASGADGAIASGSYGPAVPGGGGMAFSGTRHTTPGDVSGIVDRTYGGLDKTLDSVNDNTLLNALLSNGQSGLDRLDAQHMSSRDMPAQAMNQGLQGLLMLGEQGYGNARAGMDQFYDAQAQSFDPQSYSDMVGGLAGLMGQGYYDSSNRVSRNAGDLRSAWGDVGTQYGAGRGQLDTLFAPVADWTDAFVPRTNRALRSVMEDYEANAYKAMLDRVAESQALRAR